MTAGRSPKFANILNGTGLRILNPSAVRSALGLGTIATQNSNSVSITGGSMNNVSASSMSITNSNIYSSNLYSPYISNASELTVAGATKLSGRFQTPPVVYSSAATLGNEMVSLMRPAGGGGGLCSGTPTNACNTYSYGSCPTELGCYVSSVYCPDYYGDESACLSYGCSPGYDTYYCSDSGWYDEGSCTANVGCSYSPPSYCEDLTDETSCTEGTGYYCSWDGASCSGGEYSSASCNGEYYVFNGNCDGEGGYCDGTASCSGVSVGSCTTYAGCSVVTGLSITVPSGYTGQHRIIKNVDPSGTDVYLTTTNTLQDGTTSKTLSNYGDFVYWIFEERTVACSTLYSDESSCNGDSDCYWVTGDPDYCEGTKNLSRWWDIT